jgi:HSP20 family molecular chaperone IbpA
MVKMNVPGVSARDVKVTLTGGCLRDSSKKEDESKLLSSIGVPTSLRIDFLGDERQQAERGGGGNVITIKLKRKATYDIENAKGLVCDGVLRVVVPKITLPKVDVKVASGAEAERPPAEESEVTLKFAVAGYSSSDISVELDAERERLKIFGELKDKSSEFERVVPVPRGLRAEHVTLCAVENGVLELRLRDPLAIEKRIVPVFSTSPPPLPSSPSQEVAAQEDIRVVLMKTEVPGYSAKDIECCINVDRTIEAKRSNGRGVKIGIPNSINVDSIKAYCEHGIFQVLGETEPPFTPRAVAVDIAGPSEDAEKQKMLKQLEDTMVEEDQEEEENDAVLVNKKEGVEEEKKTSA